MERAASEMFTKSVNTGHHTDTNTFQYIQLTAEIKEVMKIFSIVLSAEYNACSIVLSTEYNVCDVLWSINKKCPWKRKIIQVKYAEYGTT